MADFEVIPNSPEEFRRYQEREGIRSLERLIAKVENQQKQLDSLTERLNEKYVTQDQFYPIRIVIYGEVGTILFTFIVAILTLVIQHK
jgi:hypothetical protein